MKEMKVIKLKESDIQRIVKRVLTEQEMSYEDPRIDAMNSRKKVNKDQLLKLIPVGQTPMIMNIQDKYLVVVDKNSNYYELI